MQAGSWRWRGTNTGSPVRRKYSTGAAAKFSSCRSLGYQYCFQLMGLEVRRLRNRAPQVVFNHQHFGFRVRKQLQVLSRRQLIVQRN